MERAVGIDYEGALAFAERLKQQRRKPLRAFVVYFVRADLVGLIKIGVTDQIELRLQQLRAASPVPLTLLGTMPGGVDLEKRLHHRFRAARDHGEWFRPTAALLTLIASRKVRKPSL